VAWLNGWRISLARAREQTRLRGNIGKTSCLLRRAAQPDGVHEGDAMALWLHGVTAAKKRRRILKDVMSGIPLGEAPCSGF